MRRLYVVRHAKSSWSDDRLDDRDRPLSRRGHKATSLLAAHFADIGLAPDLVVSSPARRARETTEGFARAWGTDTAVRFDEELYGADADDVLEILRRTPTDVRSLMVVGHNPAMQELVLLLIGDRHGGTVARIRQKFPTGAVATIDHHDDWGLLRPDAGRLIGYLTPRDLA